jgi:hypothetical protein
LRQSRIFRDVSRIACFASKVVQPGFAACCEEVALPFRTIGPLLPWAVPFEVHGIAAKKKDNR